MKPGPKKSPLVSSEGNTSEMCSSLVVFKGRELPGSRKNEKLLLTEQLYFVKWVSLYDSNAICASPGRTERDFLLRKTWAYFSRRKIMR